MTVNAVDRSDRTDAASKKSNDDHHTAWNAAVAASQQAKARAKATSLIDDDGTANNCLDRASAAAKDGQDNVVFLKDKAAASNGVGHVVVQNASTGQVTDPEGPDASTKSKDMASYLDQASSSGHQVSVAASAPAADVHRVLDLPQDQRAAAISKDDPSLAGIENARFADSMTPATTTGTGDTGNSLSSAVSGGVWTDASKSTLIGIGAAPQVPADQLTDSTADAQKLASGTKVQDLVSSGQSTASIQGAYELLGISNRQISSYAEEAAKGGVGKNQQIFGTLTYTPTGNAAFTALKSAAQMRAAATATGVQDIQHDGSTQAIWSPIGGEPITAATTGATAATGSSLPDGLGFQEMEGAVHQGVANSKAFSYPDFVASGMLYGSGGIYINKAIPANRSAFGGDDAGSATTAMAKGSALLAGVQVQNPDDPGAIASTPDEAAQSAARQLDGLDTGNWTSQTAQEAVLAGNTVMQAILPDVVDNLQAAGGPAAGQVPTDLASYQSPEEQAQTYRDAVDSALTSHGIDANARDIASTLQSAAASPAFSQALASGGASAVDQQKTADNTYNLIGEFDPQTLQAGTIAQKMAGSTQEGQLARKLLGSMISTPAPAPSQDNARASAATLAQWYLGSVRYAIGAAGSAVGEADVASKLNTFKNLVQGATAGLHVTTSMTTNADGSVGLNLQPNFYYQGQAVATNENGLQKWALAQAGLNAVPGVSQWQATVGQKISSVIDSNKLGALDTLSALGSLGARIGSGATDPTTVSLSVADALQAAAWISQPERVSAIEQGFSTVAQTASNSLVQNGWLPVGIGRSVFDAFNIPVSSDPETSIGKFVSNVLPAGTAAGNLIYGVPKVVAGIKDIVNQNYVTGSVNTATGVLDIYNALAQASRSVNGPAAWQNGINSFGNAIPSALDVYFRMAASAGLAATGSYLAAGG